MKQTLKILLLLLVGLLHLANCKVFKKEKKDDNTPLLLSLALLQGCVLEGEITTDTTVGDCTLRGTVFVKNGATLTILPGSTIKGESNSSLFVLQGSKLIAEGEPTKPIVFTSSKPEGERKAQDWGGIVLIGRSLHQEAGTLPQTEGTNKQTYGEGNDPNDNSGKLKYVRIEFAGAEVAPGDELNNLSLYTVGKGTTIEFIQVHMGFDDGVEIWGGRVEPKYILATGIADDDIDVDEGYFGEIKYVLGYKYPIAAGITYSGDPGGFELDGANDYPQDKQPRHADLNTKGASNFIVSNFTMIGSKDKNNIKYGVVRDCARVTFKNGQFVNFGESNIRDRATGDCETTVDGAISGTKDSIINCENVRADVSTNLSYTHNSSNCTINANSVSLSDIVIQPYDLNAPNTPPVFNVANVQAFSGSGVGNWTQGWTNWSNK